MTPCAIIWLTARHCDDMAALKAASTHSTAAFVGKVRDTSAPLITSGPPPFSSDENTRSPRGWDSESAP